MYDYNHSHNKTKLIGKAKLKNTSSDCNGGFYTLSFASRLYKLCHNMLRPNFYNCHPILIKILTTCTNAHAFQFTDHGSWFLHLKLYGKNDVVV